MALFERKLKKEAKDNAPKKEKKAVSQAKSSKPKADSARTSAPLGRVLIRPRITEKAANMTAQNVYTFDVAKTATKKQIALAIKSLYNVEPVKVNVVNVRGTRVRLRGKRGFGATPAFRKAYVYLKKGEEIQLA